MIHGAAGLTPGMAGTTTTETPTYVGPGRALSTLSGDIGPTFQMLAPRGRAAGTPGTLGCMIATDAHLVARLHVDLGHVSSAVCMAG
jgi:hypothetical protein